MLTWLFYHSVFASQPSSFPAHLQLQMRTTVKPMTGVTINQTMKYLRHDHSSLSDHLRYANRLANTTEIDVFEMNFVHVVSDDAFLTQRYRSGSVSSLLASIQITFYSTALMLSSGPHYLEVLCTRQSIELFLQWMNSRAPYELKLLPRSQRQIIILLLVCFRGLSCPRLQRFLAHISPPCKKADQLCKLTQPGSIFIIQTQYQCQIADALKNRNSVASKISSHTSFNIKQISPYTLYMLQPKNRFIKPIKKQIMKPPFIELQVSTWAKDSHALYDYQATDKRFFNETFQINRNCKIYRHITSMKTYIQYEEDSKELPMENIYICSVHFDPNTKIFKIQSADVTGVLPHPFLRNEHPDIFRNSYLVIRDFEKDQSVEGYPLQTGNYVKLGRIEYLVIEIRDSKGTSTLKETSHLQLNKDVHKVGSEALAGSCKICLCDESTQSDPLISPCNCKGTCQLVHAGCLKNWINSKVKRQLNGIAISYNFSKFECEICKTLLPKLVELKDGTGVEMITFDKPQRPYVVLQSVTEKHERREQLKERNLHVVSPDEKTPVKMGRGHQCQIRITDISVSRTHSEIKYLNDKFYVTDLKSKFGTLVKFRQEFELYDQLKLQYGRTCFDFLLKGQELTQRDLLEEELASRPVFYTRAQLKERGELSDDDEEY